MRLAKIFPTFFFSFLCFFQIKMPYSQKPSLRFATVPYRLFFGRSTYFVTNQPKIQRLILADLQRFKIKTFWEGHKIWKKNPSCFDITIVAFKFFWNSRLVFSIFRAICVNLTNQSFSFGLFGDKIWWSDKEQPVQLHSCHITKVFSNYVQLHEKIQHLQRYKPGHQSCERRVSKL